ncbi:MAG: hypothetical protein LBP31_03025 [Holosporales bacterium]|nr:hypothetical protein [Holosporales bacterium]
MIVKKRILMLWIILSALLCKDSSAVDSSINCEFPKKLSQVVQVVMIEKFKGSPVPPLATVKREDLVISSGAGVENTTLVKKRHHHQYSSAGYEKLGDHDHLSMAESIEITKKASSLLQNKSITSVLSQNLPFKTSVETILGIQKFPTTDKEEIIGMILKLPEESFFAPIAFIAAGQQNVFDGLASQINPDFMKYSRWLSWTNLAGVISGLAADGFNIALTLFFPHYAMSIGVATATMLDGLSTCGGYWLSSKIKNLLNASMPDLQNRPTITFDATGKEDILTSAKSIMDIYTHIQTHVMVHKQAYDNNSELKTDIASFLDLKKSIDRKVSSTKSGGIIGKALYALSFLSKLGTAGINMAGQSKQTYARVVSATSLISSSSSKEMAEINKDAMYAEIAIHCAQAYLLLLKIVDYLRDFHEA